MWPDGHSELILLVSPHAPNFQCWMSFLAPTAPAHLASFQFFKPTKGPSRSFPHAVLSRLSGWSAPCYSFMKDLTCHFFERPFLASSIILYSCALFISFIMSFTTCTLYFIPLFVCSKSASPYIVNSMMARNALCMTVIRENFLK